MSKSILIESTSDTAEEQGVVLKHYGYEPQAPETPEPDAKTEKSDQPEKKETREPAEPADKHVDPPAESTEEKGKTAAVTETAPKQEQVEEPHREDFDSEEKFEAAVEDFKDKQKPKGDGGFQRRIDKLTKKLRSAEAKLED